MQAVYPKRLNIGRWHIKCLDVSTALLFAHSNNHKCKTAEHNKCSDMATAHEHTVGDVFCSKKSSSVLLVHEQQALQRPLILCYGVNACLIKKEKKVTF